MVLRGIIVGIGAAFVGSFLVGVLHTHTRAPIVEKVQAVAGTLTISGTDQTITGDITAARLLDQANTSYFIDPAASSTSLVTAGKVAVATTSATENFTVAGNIGFTGGGKIKDSAGQLQLQAGGTGTGTTGTGSIYFLDSSGTARGRFETNTTFSATGGTITTSGGYTIHTFTTSGTFTPSGAGNVEYLVVGGGGGGGGAVTHDFADGSGGGGAGGFRTATGLAVTAQAYTVTVGAGGAGAPGTAQNGTKGSDSSFAGITATGGGYGGKGDDGVGGGAGGSGGGGGGNCTGGDNPGGAGNTPSTSPSQGNNGGGGVGACDKRSGGGGGGAGAVGSNSPSQNGGAGGAGTASSISGSSVTYTGGGGGSSGTGCCSGGAGGSGGGGVGANVSGSTAGAGTANTGGGGGGGPTSASGVGAGGAGGSGIIIIRYLTSSVITYGTYYLGSTNTSSQDLAEYYVTGDNTIEAGDVVTISNQEVRIRNQGGTEEVATTKGVLRKSDTPYDRNLIGIISTNPGVLMGSIDGENKEDKRMLALSGRVPVKIDQDSPTIEVGDFLTSSTKPGFAMKATRPGYVVGRALENWTPLRQGFGGASRIEAFIQLTYYMGDIDPWGNFKTLEVDTLKVNKTLEVGGVNVMDEINDLKRRLDALEVK